MTLEDRIYCLEETSLPDDLMSLLVQADIYYMQHKDAESERLVVHIEDECKKRGIKIYKPLFAMNL